jgi:hypothetical protein
MSVIMAYYMVVLRSNAKFHWALVVFFVSGAWAQTLLPTSARKEFVYLGGRLVAVEAVTVVSPPPTVPAPVFWHKFDDGATNVATAEVGDNCSLSNHVWVQDPPSSGNYAVEFNGTTTIANCGSALDNLAPAFSVAAWIRPDNFGESSLGHIIAKVNASSNRSWFLHVSDSPGTTDGFRGIVVQANNTNQDHWEAAATLTPNGTTWYHLAWVVSNCSDLGTCTAQLYLNGSPVGIQVVNDTGARPDDSTFQVSIGNRPAGDRTFDGLIDDVRVWSQALSGAEISAVYAGGRE